MPESKVGQIYESMSKVLAEIDAIEKSRRNEQGKGYSFRGIDDVYNTMHPIFAKFGIFSIPTVVEKFREERKSSNGSALIYTLLKVMYRFYAVDGSYVEAIVIGEAFDSGDKSSNKAMSAAHKYAILQTFCIPTIEDKDTENQSPSVVPKETKDQEKSKPHVQPKQTPLANPQAQLSTKPAQVDKSNVLNLLSEDEARKLLFVEVGTLIKKKLTMTKEQALDYMCMQMGKKTPYELTIDDLKRIKASLNKPQLPPDGSFEDFR